MSHPFTRIVFRVGDDDAKKLAEGFSFFEAKDLRNLETGQAVCRVERSDFDFNLSVPLPGEPDKDTAALRRQEVITVSRKKYGTARADVEAMLAKSRATPAPDEPPAKPAPFVPQAPPTPIPQSSEMPKVITAPAKAETKPPVADRPQGTRDLGRGGAQHQAIQKRIKEAAEELGFRSIIEKPVLDGQGSVDLWLERTGQSIACEISISTTIDHEVGNVAKCLKAGLPKVAVVCLHEERLKKIASAVSGSLGAELAARVEYFQPDPFIAYLKSLPLPVVPTPAVPKIHRGYKVKSSFSDLSPEEQKQREEMAIQSIAEAMKKRK